MISKLKEKVVLIPLLVVAFAYLLGMSLRDSQATEPPYYYIMECEKINSFVKIEDGVITTKEDQFCVLKWQDKVHMGKKVSML